MKSSIRLIALAAAAILAAAVSPAAAQNFEVPDAFTATRDVELKAEPGLVPVLSVQPPEGPFAELSELTLYKVTTPIEDPDHWLEAQVRLIVVDPEHDPEALFASPDSPFSDPSFDFLRNLLPMLMESVRTLGALPLEACEGPTTGYNASGDFRELYCVWGIGPLRQYRQLRLQELDGEWYFTDIRTMNERRLRHFVAIANSFQK